MCGVAGILDLSGRAPPTREALTPMLVALKHRGPDGNGTYVSDEVGLAHTRLSIIDLAGGEQPIHNEDKSIWVVFNGEIFNYIELRAELIALGHHFYTHSDTEVLVHLYEQFGRAFVERLNGQFAIALWDARRHELILVRDRVGIRPLFYAEADGCFFFASEVKALFTQREIARRIDPIALHEISTYWATIGARSAFAGVSTLKPGEMLVVSRHARRAITYWDWSFPALDASANEASPRSEGDYADELKSLLIDAVRLQLRADVPVGAYLSGGLDSSVTTSLIHHFTETKLRTFSLTFEDAEFDERQHQQSLVNYLGTAHSSTECTRADIANAFPRTILHTESPVVRSAPTPLMLLSAHVRQSGYKVVLTGEGADEVFGGYDIFKEAKIRRFWAAQPHSSWRPRILERLYPYLKHSPVGGNAFSQAFFADGMELIDTPFFAHAPRWNTTRRIAQFFSPMLREAMAEAHPFAALQSTLPAQLSSWAPLSRDQYIEAHTLMSGYLLSSQGDRVAMANSIEGRFPFLDHRVIEFANRLPPKLKLRALTEKYLLKKSMKGLLPDALLARTKQPYRAPDAASFFVNGQAVPYVADLLSENQLSRVGHFAPRAVAKLLEKCRAGRAIGFADNMAFMFVLSTMLLHEQFVEQRSTMM